MRAMLLALTSAALSTVPLAAQQRDTAVAQRQPVADSTTAVALPPLVVSASQFRLPADRVGFAVQVLGPHELATQPSLYAAGALRSLSPGFIDEAAGPGGPTIVRLRGGEEVFTQILIDGIEANENGGFFDFQGLSLTAMDRIEVLRGPQSALYGSSAVSGVVQLSTVPGEVGRPRVELQAEGGQGSGVGGGSALGRVTVSGGSPALRYAGGGGVTYSRGIWTLPNDIHTSDFVLRLDAQPARRWSLTGTARAIQMSAHLPVRDPGATRVPLDPNARNDRDRFLSGLTATYAASPRWTHQLRGTIYRQRFVYDDQLDPLPESLPFFVFNANFRQNSLLWRSALEYVGRIVTAPHATTSVGLAYGAQWQKEDLQERTAGDFGDGRQHLARSSTSGFAELRASLARHLDLLAGTRVEKYQGLPSQYTPRASAVLHFVPGRFSVRAAVGRAYKAPNLQEQYLDNPFISSNPDLEPETSVSWEAGTDIRDSGRFWASITFFHQDYDNLIRSVTLEGTDRQINRNVGKSKAVGVEWTLRYQPVTRWVLGSAGAWIRTEIIDNTGLNPVEFPRGESLPFRPALTANGFVEYHPTGRFTLVGRGLFVGRQTVLTERFSGERKRLQPYLLAGVNGTYLLRSGMSVYLRVDNLFDTSYQTAFDRHGIPVTGALGFRLGT